MGEGASVEAALRLVTQWQPDILLLDLDIPGNGLSALKDIGTVAPATRIVVLAFAASEDYLVAALSGG